MLTEVNVVKYIMRERRRERELYSYRSSSGSLIFTFVCSSLLNLATISKKCRYHKTVGYMYVPLAGLNTPPVFLLHTAHRSVLR